MIARIASFLDRHSTGAGLLMILVTVGVAVMLFNQQRISVALGDTEEVSAVFDRGYRLEPYRSKVKVAGIPVGLVTGVEERDRNVVVTMAVDPGTRAVLGTAPTADVRPHTLLGGNYYVALGPGGDEGPLAGPIPDERTTVPVELDRVLEILQEDARDGAVTALSQLDEALSNEGSERARDVLSNAPDMLEPGGRVLDALRGREDDDLSDLVLDLDAVTAALTDDPDELERLLSATAGTAAVLESTTEAQRRLLDGLAPSLRATRQGMSDLDGSLARLRAVASPLRPSIAELHNVLVRAEFILDEARPVIADLRPVAADLRPVVDDLRPISEDAQHILGQLRGPVLRRLNNTLVPALNDSYRGEDELLYEEIAYMLTGLAGISQYTDSNGPAVSFQPGGGIETLSGTPTELSRPFGDPKDPRSSEVSP